MNAFIFVLAKIDVDGIGDNEKVNTTPSPEKQSYIWGILNTIKMISLTVNTKR